MTDFSKKRSFGPVPNYPLVESYKRKNDKFIVIAGPCSVESEDHIKRMAEKVAEAGATHLRGGVWRGGTYPGQKIGFIEKKIIKAFHDAAHANGLRNIIEVLQYDQASMELQFDYADCFQVGARAQQHYQLLHTIGRWSSKPIFLKRNTGCTTDELLGSAEHLLRAGVKELHLIERGSSTHANDVRWAPMIHTIPSVQSICDIPIIIDASHSTGRRDMIESITLAGVAAGADGCLIEVHDRPDESLSDPDQAILPEVFTHIVEKIKAIREVLK